VLKFEKLIDWEEKLMHNKWSINWVEKEKHWIIYCLAKTNR